MSLVLEAWPTAAIDNIEWMAIFKERKEWGFFGGGVMFDEPNVKETEVPAHWPYFLNQS